MIQNQLAPAFNAVYSSPPPPRTAEQQALSDAMASYWTNFARIGDPSIGLAVPTTWAPFAGGNLLGLDIASAGGVAMFNTFAADHQCTTTWSTLAF